MTELDDTVLFKGMLSFADLSPGKNSLWFQALQDGHAIPGQGQFDFWVVRETDVLDELTDNEASVSVIDMPVTFAQDCSANIQTLAVSEVEGAGAAKAPPAAGSGVWEGFLSAEWALGYRNFTGGCREDHMVEMVGEVLRRARLRADGAAGGDGGAEASVDKDKEGRQGAAVGQRPVVVDLGCGGAHLATMLPADVEYIAVDVVPRSRPTRVCNFNRWQFPFFHDTRVDAVVVQGLLEYVVDKSMFLRLLRGLCAPVVLTYNLSPSLDFEKGWVTPLRLSTLRRLLRAAGFRVASERRSGCAWFRKPSDTPYTSEVVFLLQPRPWTSRSLSPAPPLLPYSPGLVESSPGGAPAPRRARFAGEDAVTLPMGINQNRVLLQWIHGQDVGQMLRDACRWVLQSPVREACVETLLTVARQWKLMRQ